MEGKLKAHKVVICYWKNICSLLKVFDSFGEKLKASLGVSVIYSFLVAYWSY